MSYTRCPICKNKFYKKSCAKYCSDACRSGKPKGIKWVRCPVCKYNFYKKRSGQKYCSDSCSEEANRESSSQKKLLKNYLKKCSLCGKFFNTRRSQAKYCSLECRVRGHRKKVQQYYLLKHSWNILRFQVFERDGFKCQYCGRRPWKYNVVLVVDHMKPKIKDGQDVLTNLITSCEECNGSKGPRDLLDERLLRTIKKRTEKYLEKIDKNQIVANL